MNARQVESLRAQIESAVESTGLRVTRLWPTGKGFGFAFVRIGKPTFWEELAPTYTSARGRVNFTVCHGACHSAERHAKLLAKSAIRAAIPMCRGIQIVATYDDHRDKLVVLPGLGVAHNV